MLGAGPAAAKSDKVIRYPFEQVWPAAIRFLRVDEGHEIIERDPEAGYVLFELRQEGKTFRGSFELVRVPGDDGERLRIVVGLESRPSYMEQTMIDRFMSKLRSELGPPPRPKPTPKPAPAPAPVPKQGDEAADLNRTRAYAGMARCWQKHARLSACKYAAPPTQHPGSAAQTSTRESNNLCREQPARNSQRTQGVDSAQC